MRTWVLFKRSKELLGVNQTEAAFSSGIPRHRIQYMETQLRDLDSEDSKKLLSWLHGEACARRDAIERLLSDLESGGAE